MVECGDRGQLDLEPPPRGGVLRERQQETDEQRAPGPLLARRVEGSQHVDGDDPLKPVRTDHRAEHGHHRKSIMAVPGAAAHLGTPVA